MGSIPPGQRGGERSRVSGYLKMGNCNHRRYVPQLLDLVAAGLVDPAAFITQEEKPASAIEAYETFDRREEGWIKTPLDVS